MDTNAPATTKNTNAFFLQAGLAFGVALLTMVVAIFYVPVDPWIRAFLGLGTMFLTTSAFTLAKCVRDAQENSYVVTVSTRPASTGSCPSTTRGTSPPDHP